ncbi:MAG: carbohydrate kinase [Verrucomicrobia bacterium]|nr:carbohydrate kinase [Verrucomicrobiota bacterium]MCH8510616.1 carbohydrate kinase [Kiritimatiellia bacterium]
MTDPRHQLAQTLRMRREFVEDLNVVAGFDGFVDQLAQIVEERQNLETFSPVPTISRFSELIGQAAGRSSLREFVVRSVDAGGCAVNLGDGIASLGVNLDYFGTLGEPVHPAFESFVKNCRSCTSWGREPGFTMAMEFQDGKYMLSSVSQLGEFDETNVENHLADGAFQSACISAPLIALTNWTLYPHMTACWALLQRQVFANLEHNPWYFVDLVDPRGRSKADLREMLPVLSAFENHGRCILGGNLNEANVIASLLGIGEVNEEGPAVAELCQALRVALNISEVAIHCIAGAAVATTEGETWVDGPYTPSPVKSTGAGDRYNAGYCLGRMLDLCETDRCLLGVATSGFFVRNARSGSLDEIADFLEAWSKKNLKD